MEKTTIPMPDLEGGGAYAPIMAALPSYEGFMKGILMKRRGDLTKTQMDMLVCLLFAGKMGMSQVADRLAISKEQATRAAGPLVERGLVRRARSAENYRVVEIDLTDSGRAFLEATRDDIDREISEQLAPLSQRDRDRLLEASRTAVEILRKLS